MKIYQFFLLTTTLILFTGCAGAYQKIIPEQIDQLNSFVSDEIEMDYQYEQLSKKYEKRQQRKGLRLVSAKITNHSPENISLGNNYTLAFSNGDEVELLPTNQAVKKLKQHSLTYLLYLLIPPVGVQTFDDNLSNDNDVPFATRLVGPGLAAGNLYQSASANKNLKENLMQYNLQGVEIAPGETKYGIFAISTNEYRSIELVAMK